jgi:hypothetical protein
MTRQDKTVQRQCKDKARPTNKQTNNKTVRKEFREQIERELQVPSPEEKRGRKTVLKLAPGK